MTKKQTTVLLDIVKNGYCNLLRKCYDKCSIKEECNEIKKVLKRSIQISAREKAQQKLISIAKDKLILVKS
jgi:hypothetical protein